MFKKDTNLSLNNFFSKNRKKTSTPGQIVHRNISDFSSKAIGFCFPFKNALQFIQHVLF